EAAAQPVQPPGAPRRLPFRPLLRRRDPRRRRLPDRRRGAPRPRQPQPDDDPSRLDAV
ncbi:MAG: hypothetical protein AVDCRST_MAG19-2002, partial [uncultured Thermomicrobiales bacterium]